MTRWPHKRAAKSCLSGAARISLQAAGFWPDGKGEKSPLDRVEG
jgi:hypothetical protein